MLGRVFRYQGWLWRALNTLTDILALSVLWLLCSIPVLTLGAATTALYDSVVRCIRYKQSGPYERFFRTFKNELVPGLLLTLLWGAIAALGLWMLALLRQYSAEAPTAMAAVDAGRRNDASRAHDFFEEGAALLPFGRKLRVIDFRPEPGRHHDENPAREVFGRIRRSRGIELHFSFPPGRSSPVRLRGGRCAASSSASPSS